MPKLTEKTQEFNVQHPEIHMSGGGGVGSSADEKVLVNGVKSAPFSPHVISAKDSLSSSVASASLDFLLISLICLGAGFSSSAQSRRSPC